MRLTTNSKVWRFLLIVFLALTIFFSVLFYFKNIFIVSVIGLVLIILTEKFRKSLNRFCRKKNIPSWGKKSIAILLPIIILTSIILIGRSQIGEVVDLIKDENQTKNAGEDFFNDIKSYIPKFLGEKLITEDTITSISKETLKIAQNFIQQISFFLFTGIIIIPLMFHAYYTKRRTFINFISQNIPQKFSKGLSKAYIEVEQKLQDFLSAKVIQSLVVGAISAIGFLLVGVKAWFFLGLICGIFNIAPYIGPFLGAIPAFLTGYLDSPRTAIFAVVVVLIAQAIDNFYLQPFMIPGKVKMDPLLSICLLLIGYKLVGISGMVFALPIYIIYKTVMKELYEELVLIYPEKKPPS